MTKVFNTEFEVSMRILILLSITSKSGISVDRAAALDFITIYGGDFGITNKNLHGCNEYSFSEFAARRAITNDALKALVLDNVIRVAREQQGFHYYITSLGEKTVKILDTEYARNYAEAARKVCLRFASCSDTGLMKVINQKAMSSLRG